MRGNGEAGGCGPTLTRPFGAPSPVKGEGKACPIPSNDHNHLPR